MIAEREERSIKRGKEWYKENACEQKWEGKAKYLLRKEGDDTGKINWMKKMILLSKPENWQQMVTM